MGRKMRERGEKESEKEWGKNVRERKKLRE